MRDRRRHLCMCFYLHARDMDVAKQLVAISYDLVGFES